MQFKVSDISQILQGELIGDGDALIHTLGKIESSNPGEISFLANAKYEAEIYNTKATAVIVHKDFKPTQEVSAALIKVDDPYSSFTTLLEEYNKHLTYSKVGIEEPSSIQTEEENIGDLIYVGAFSYIGKGCTIGTNVKIHPQVYIGDNVKIGNDTVILPGAKVYSGTVIGNACTLHANCVVGSDGFGFAPQKDGSYKTIPQIGNVILANNVSIGAGATIDCATMGSTVIKEGSKIDNLVQIGHNVEIAEHTVIAAQAGVSGSTKIGSHCMIGGQVGISGHLKVPNQTKIGAQAGLMSAPKEEGQAIIGSPSMPIKDFLRAYAVFRNLPDLKKQVEEMEEKMLPLTPVG